MPLDLEARVGRIGSSDIAAVIGLNPYRSPLQVWAEMTGKVNTQEENDAMWLGSKMEQTVADFFKRKHPEYEVERHQSTLPYEDWACATPDYVFRSDVREGILECKTSGAYNKEMWLTSIPEYVHCQVIWQLGIAKYSEAIIACLCDRDLITHKVPFSKEVFEQLVEAGRKFIGMVRSDTPPEARGVDKVLLTKLYPELDDVVPLEDDEADVIVEAYLKLQAQKKDCQQKLNVIDSSMKDSQARLIQKMKGANRAQTHRAMLKFSKTEIAEHVVKAYPKYTFTLKEIKK